MLGRATAQLAPGPEPARQAEEAAIDDAPIPTEAPPFRFLEHGYRFAWFDQDGRGYQSQAGRAIGPGSESLRVLQPSFYVRAAQRDTVIWDVGFQLDVVTAASADALDAMSTASLHNEAGTLDVAATWRASDDDTIAFRGAGHLEETLRSGSLGVAYTRELAEDNATVAVSANGTVDRFDTIQPNGFTPGLAVRQTWNGNLTVSQILSRTTVGSLSYGITHQRGVLQQTWNSSPIAPCGVMPLCTERAPEIFPGTRLRHAIRATIAQRIPQSDMTLRLGYRFYADDFDVRASTIDGELIQGLGDYVGLTVRYRYHHQTSASFYYDRLPSALRFDETPRTSDSDLARFDAQLIGVRLDLFMPGTRRTGRHGFDLAYHYYFRSNTLDTHLLAFGYRRVY